MKKLDVIVPVLVLAIAFGAIYFLYTGAGFATAYGTTIIVSGDTVTPSEFYMKSPGYIMIKNQGSSSPEIEVRRSDKVVYRRMIHPGQTVTFQAKRGPYTAGTFVKMVE